MCSTCNLLRITFVLAILSFLSWLYWIYFLTIERSTFIIYQRKKCDIYIYIYNWIEFHYVEKIIEKSYKFIHFKSLFKISVLKILNIITKLVFTENDSEKLRIYEVLRGCFKLLYSEKDNKCLPQPPEQSGTRVLWLEVIETRSGRNVYCAAI